MGGEPAQRFHKKKETEKRGHIHDSRRNTKHKDPATKSSMTYKAYIVPDKYSCEVVLTIYERYNMCYEVESFKV
jgi:hypothetical protein